MRAPSGAISGLEAMLGDQRLEPFAQALALGEGNGRNRPGRDRAGRLCGVGREQEAIATQHGGGTPTRPGDAALTQVPPRAPGVEPQYLGR